MISNIKKILATSSA